MIMNTYHIFNGSFHATYTHSTTENMEHGTIKTTAKPCTQAHLIPNRQKVKITTPLPPSSLQNKLNKESYLLIYG